MKRQATMWFEQKPDCYGGETCDKVVGRWHCYADGDKDSDYQHRPLSLSVNRFPPGTRITVEEPVCPTCGETRPLKYTKSQRTILFASKCGCGFDWDQWVLEQYS